MRDTSTLFFAVGAILSLLFMGATIIGLIVDSLFPELKLLQTRTKTIKIIAIIAIALIISSYVAMTLTLLTSR